MSVLVFPSNPVNGQLFPDPPIDNVNNYIYNAATSTWRLQSITGGGVTSVTGVLPISVATGSTTPVISINTATTSSAGSIQIATLVEAAAGTNALKALTPLTGVPKNASGMTGSAFLPAGNTAARPNVSSYAGQLRYNTQIPQWEYSDGASWAPLAGGGSSQWSRQIPQVVASSAYTLAATDTGKHVYSNGSPVTVPSSVFVPGDVVSVVNNSSSNLTIIAASGVIVYLSGTILAGDRTLQPRGIATILCVDANAFIASGTGLS